MQQRGAPGEPIEQDIDRPISQPPGEERAAATLILRCTLDPSH
jgi:hypothetical protein